MLPRQFVELRDRKGPQVRAALVLVEDNPERLQFGCFVHDTAVRHINTFSAGVRNVRGGRGGEAAAELRAQAPGDEP
ncbi:hypothetical protein GCM10023324_28820 [Streptomyces youssoufiensis]